MISMAARGLFIDMVAQSCDMPIMGVFAYPKPGEKIEIFDRKFPKKFPDFARISEEKLLSLFTGTAAEKRRAFDELKQYSVVGQSSDGTFYVRKIYRLAIVRQARQTAGKQGGNPNLVKDLVNQKDNQEVKPEVNPQANQQVKGQSEPYSYSYSYNTKIKQSQSHKGINKEGPDKGRFGDDKNFKNNLLNMELMGRVDAAKAELEQTLATCFKPVNGTVKVFEDIVAVATELAVRRGKAETLMIITNKARTIAGGKRYRNPVGAFVNYCKRFGYEPVGAGGAK